MKPKWLLGGALFALLVALVMAVAALTTWQQVNANGFGDPEAHEVSAVSAFGGYLYAGTENITNRARIFRSQDLITWTPVIDPGFGIPHDTAPPAILDLTVFNSRLYASTGRGDGPGQIWRTLDGLNWAPMVIAGFADPDNVDITALVTYNGMIYAGAGNLVTGAQIWRSYTGDSNTWTQVAPTTPGTDMARITGFAEFDGGLYAVVASDAPAQVWRSFGGATWTAIVTDGFGDANTVWTGGTVVFDGSLYVGAGSQTSGVQLWRSSDGDTWQAATAPGAGDANNRQVQGLFIFQNELYATVENTVTGIEVWRTADAVLWEQVNGDGFGDANNVKSNTSNATDSFLSKLYFGTANAAAGGELWQMTPDVTPVYGVALSPDEGHAGLPGEVVNYTVTVTNTGNVSDTYDLTLGAHTWATSLSATSIALNAGASGQVTVAVTVPADAQANSSDAVTVTATSQSDASASDSTVLTTSCTQVFGVVLSADDALAGVPGETVTYTVAVTNTGNGSDTYALSVTGNAWATTLSAPSVTLAAGASGQVQVAVEIPPDALASATDAATVTATSQGNGSVSDSAVLTTSCTQVYGVLLAPDMALAGLPGDVVTYTVTISNTGNGSDTFDLLLSGNGWDTTLSAPTVTLGAGAIGQVTVAVTVPTDAQLGDSDSVTLSATSQGNGGVGDSMLLTTSCNVVYGVSLSPDDALTGLPGETVTYTVDILNTGNVPDTYDLVLSGNAWLTTLSASTFTLAAGAGGQVDVIVIVPTDAQAADMDVAVLTATSQGDAGVSDSTVLTTTCTVPAIFHHVYLPGLTNQSP